jgi:hypothetical protein
VPDRTNVELIAGEHLVAQRKAIEGHHKRDAHLLAVWAMVAGIATPIAQVGLEEEKFAKMPGLMLNIRRGIWPESRVQR